MTPADLTSEREAELLNTMTELRARLAEAEGRVGELTRYFMLGEAYALIPVVETLVRLGEHVKEEHDCDTHGWEVTEESVCKARAWLASIAKTPAQVDALLVGRARVIEAAKRKRLVLKEFSMVENEDGERASDGPRHDADEELAVSTDALLALEAAEVK